MSAPKEQRTSPGPATGSSQPGALGELFGKLERALSEHAPDYASSLRPGAGDADVTRLKAGLAKVLPKKVQPPPEIEALVRWHDGQAADSYTQFPTLTGMGT